MSYEIIKSVNIKKRTVTAACNNLRPLTYTTSKLTSDDGTEETFIKHCLVAFNDGDFQSNSSSCWKFNYSIFLFKKNNKTLYDKLNKIIWENYDYKTKTKLFTDDEINEAKVTLKNELYSVYKSLDNLHTGNFVITFRGYPIVSITKRSIKTTWNDNFKKFKSYEEAENYLVSKVYDDVDPDFKIVELK